jgi:ubiquinone/menaquinone biosynthesis C-methylase UbiE
MGTREFFDAVERERYEGDDFMHDLVGFDRWYDRSILEVGCGMGTDLLQFARGGAKVHGIDLTDKGVELTGQRLQMYGYEGDVGVGDAEHIPYPDDTFDLVYSWGVIHITDNPDAAAREIVRVCKPGGSILVMVYNRYSLFSLQSWLVYGLGKGKPFETLDRIIADNIESPGTRVYTPKQFRQLFPTLDDVSTRTIVTRYDIRLGRRGYLPTWTRRLVPSRFGWNLVLEARKPPGP